MLIVTAKKGTEASNLAPFLDCTFRRNQATGAPNGLRLDEKFMWVDGLSEDLNTDEAEAGPLVVAGGLSLGQKEILAIGRDIKRPVTVLDRYLVILLGITSGRRGTQPA